MLIYNFRNEKLYNKIRRENILIYLIYRDLVKKFILCGGITNTFYLNLSINFIWKNNSIPPNIH